MSCAQPWWLGNTVGAARGSCPPPQLYLSRVKEPKFFLTDEADGPPRPQGGPGDAKTLSEQVRPAGHIGTAHQSIDRPIQD